MRTLTLLFHLIVVQMTFGQEAFLQENGRDLASVEKEVSEPKKVSIYVKDMRTMKTVPYFTVDFSSCGHPKYRSSEMGVFSMETQEGFACYVRITKVGYANLDLLIDYESIDGDKKTYNVFLSRSPNYYHGTIKDSLDRHLYLEDTEVELVCNSDKQIQQVISNANGEFAVYLRPNQMYTLNLKRSAYRSATYQFKTGDKVDPNLLKGMLLKPLVTKLRRDRGHSVVKKNRASRSTGHNYFSVQVLSRQLGKINLAEHKQHLNGYGEVFIEMDGEISKVKVGKYFNRTKAEKVLRDIRAQEGYEDAFLTQTIKKSAPAEGKEQIKPQYMVRLASYLNPELFDGKNLAHLGSVKALEKGEWTIMLIEGFGNLQEATQASTAAKDQGFMAAHVVEWKDNLLKRVP
ncbi:MAG: hypothetical protein HKN87_15075 [Saprospiraceae bacterium]|nr:hypothetical protein [Saprospiraceae bacterium]